MNTLLVIGKLALSTPKRGVFGKVQGILVRYCAWNARRAHRKEKQRLIILCPQEVAERLVGIDSGDIILWEDLPNFARSHVNLHNREFTEFFRYTDRVIRILERHPLSTVEGISVPEALRYPFLAPHFENFPFWVSGIQDIVKRYEIDRALLFDDASYFGSLAFAALKAMGVACSISKFAPLRKISKIEKVVMDLEECRFFRATIRRCERLNKASSRRQPQSSMGVVAFMSKPRSYRYMHPVLRKLSLMGAKSTVLCSLLSLDRGTLPGFEYEAFFPQRKNRPDNVRVLASRLKQIWRKSEREINELPDKFQGVPISPFHINEIKRIWFVRGLDAALLCQSSNGILDKTKTKCLFLQDPLEGSYILSRRAEESGVPRIFYYGVYTGAVSVANLWESIIPKMADLIATLNERMRDRLIEKNLFPARSVHLVGNVLGRNSNAQDRAEIRVRVCETLGLDPERKIVLLLSRAISPALRKEDKAILFRKTDEACKQLGAQLIIKGHPYEDKSSLESEISDWNCCAAVVLNEIPLEDLSLASDLAVNHPASSSSLDCICSKIPVIILGSEIEFDQYDANDDAFAYRKHGAAKCLLQNENLLSPMNDLLFNEKIRNHQIQAGLRFAERIAGPMDGMAADRLAQLALGMS